MPLLKMLEEKPPARCFFLMILACSRQGLACPTIGSRCRELRLSRWGHETLPARAWIRQDVDVPSDTAALTNCPPESVGERDRGLISGRGGLSILLPN